MSGRKSNYAFKPIAEQPLRSNQTIVPQRLNAALAIIASTSMVLIFALVSIVSLGSQPEIQSDGEPANWSDSPSVMACTPSQLEPGGKLVLTLGPRHGSELAIRREKDGVWFFLVARYPPDDMQSLMSHDELQKAAVVEIPASVTGYAWEVGRGNERIFDGSGDYGVFISEILESEIGGYACKISFKQPVPDG